MIETQIAADILQHVRDQGACTAGFASVRDLRRAPAFMMMPLRPHVDRAGAVPVETGLPEGEVRWIEGFHSVLVFAYPHPEEKAYLDWWLDGKNTVGNLKLIQIGRDLAAYIRTKYPEVKCLPLNYHVEKGGIWLKDSAVIAGFGVIGRNNLLITPEYGPRVRLRAMFLSLDIPSTGAAAWDPCEHCTAPCLSACPQNAFEKRVYRQQDYQGLSQLPGRTGVYDLCACDIQMAVNIEKGIKDRTEVPEYGVAQSVIHYCRNCELRCPVGNNDK